MKIKLASLFLLSFLIFGGCENPTSEAPTEDDTTPPSNVTSLSENIGSENVIITWENPAETDFDHVDIFYGIGEPDTKYEGNIDPQGTTIGNLVNYSEYTLLIKSVDNHGNSSDGIITVFTPAAAIEGNGFSIAQFPGDKGIFDLKVENESLTMIYAQNQSSILVPKGTNDFTTNTITRKFWIAETEFTNKQTLSVLQWAYENGKFSTNVSDQNGLDTTSVKLGNQQLLDLDDADCHISFDGLGKFGVDIGFENNPTTNITWFGAIAICNWLTEMRDGNTTNIVYSGIDSDWDDIETVEDASKSGYRLPSDHDEWAYAAKYRGSDSTNTVSGFENPYFTKGESASGAIDLASNTSANQSVAVYSGLIPTPTDEAEVKSLGVSSMNSLGLYDMSGNVLEWFFAGWQDRDGTACSWDRGVSYLNMNSWGSLEAESGGGNQGFRLCRTEI